jgi:hypothetical protein
VLRGIPSRRTRGVVALILAAFTLALALAGPAGVGAQSPPADGCDPSDPVACIPLPEQEGTSDQPAPQIAAPLPPGPPACAPVSVRSTAPETSIATPLPPGCPVQDVVATMNRANVLWARAVRTLDPMGLPEVWAGPALDGVRTYVEQLRRAGQYVTPELRAIVLTGLQTDGRRAHLTTTEVWFQQLRWWPSGGVVVEDLQRVSNLYELERRAGRWVVVRNEVRPGGTPIPLPPLPAPPPCIAIFPPPPGCGGTDAPAASVTVTADKEIYRPGEPVVATVTNTGSTTLSGGGGYACGLVEVAVAVGEGDLYRPAPGGAEVCTAIAQLLRPGESRTETFSFDQPGRYRLIVRLTAEGSPAGQVVVASDPFTVAVD